MAALAPGCVQGRRVGHRTLRTQALPSVRETGARSELPVSARTSPNQALLPRKLVLCLPSASLRPISSPHFFQRDGHGRGGLHTDCQGAPERPCPWQPRRCWGRLKQVGCTRPGRLRPGAWRKARHAGRTAAGGHLGPAHSTGYL